MANEMIAIAEPDDGVSSRPQVILDSDSGLQGKPQLASFEANGSGARQRPPMARNMDELIATSIVIGYPGGVRDVPVRTSRDIEFFIYARLGWES